MKRLIAAAVVLVLLIFTCFASALITENRCDMLLQELNGINGIDAQTEEKLTEIKDKFQKSENLLCVFTSRNHIEEIEDSFTKLIACAKTNNLSVFLPEIDSLKLKLTHLKESEQLRLRSFF